MRVAVLDDIHQAYESTAGAVRLRERAEINTARGPIVDEAALTDALTNRRIAGAALDVLDTEPLPASHALAALPNVIRTPHVGWPTDRKYAQFADAAADVLLAWPDGRHVPRFADSR